MADKQTKLPHVSKAQLIRKGNKPLMEKRRRARINHLLNELAALLLKGQDKSNTQHSKLEKADILEMTVKHVKYLENQLILKSMDIDPAILSKYRIGYKHCANEISRYLGSVQNLDDDVRDRINDHISNRIHMTGNGPQQDLKPPSRVENIENENIPENVFLKPEAMEQDLPNSIPSKISSPNDYPMKALQVNIPNSLPLSEMAIPMLPSYTDKILSPPTAAISLCDNSSISDPFKQPDNYRARSTVVATPTVEHALKSSGAKLTIDIPPNREQYIHHTKQTVSVQPFTTTVRPRTNATPTEKVKPITPKTAIDESTTTMSKPMLVEFSPSTVAGSFQIIPAPIYGGQPVALYLAPTSALPTTTCYMTSSATNTSPTMTTATPTYTGRTLSFQMPQVVAAVVSPPTVGLRSPQAAAPAYSSVTGYSGLGNFSPSLPVSASLCASSYNSSVFASASSHSNEASRDQQIESVNTPAEFRSSSTCSSESEVNIWRPW